MANIVRVAVTGAAGQVAYTLLPRLASGEVFGPDTQVVLQLLEIPRSINPKPMEMLEGVAMELEDCGFATLKEIIVTDDENKAFDGCNWALLVGAAPRGPGMERKDLLAQERPDLPEAGQGARRQGGRRRAHPDRRQSVQHQLPDRLQQRPSIPAERWTAMTRLDHNRAVAALAKKAGVGNSAVTCMTIWGNHSNTQYPDFTNAKINGKPATEVITDRAWLETAFVTGCQERGKAVIEKRGLSSAFSAANGALDHVKSLLKPTPANDWVSMAVVSKGQYGVPAGLVFGYPCASDGKGNFTVVERRQARHLRARRSSS